MKKLFVLLLVSAMLLCMVACDRNGMEIADDTTDNTYDNTVTTDSQETGALTERGTSVFNTENITRITFYAYYGEGKGSEVPAENMAEIINWLDSFTIGEKAPELLIPGTNTVCVEIEYSDGTVIKTGMDTATIAGITYYTKGDTEPECFEDILSKTSYK